MPERPYPDEDIALLNARVKAVNEEHRSAREDPITAGLRVLAKYYRIPDSWKSEGDRLKASELLQMAQKGQGIELGIVQALAEAREEGGRSMLKTYDEVPLFKTEDGVTWHSWDSGTTWWRGQPCELSHDYPTSKLAIAHQAYSARFGDSA